MKPAAFLFLLALALPLGSASAGPISSGGGMGSPYARRTSELTAILQSTAVSDAVRAMNQIEEIRFLDASDGKSRFHVASRKCSMVVEVSFSIQGDNEPQASVRIEQSSCR